VESLENQNQVSQASHRSLEISQKRRDSHISTAPALSVSLYAGTPEQKNRGYGKVEIQKPDSHFPTAPTACGARKNDLLKTRSNRARKDHSHRSRLPSVSVSSCFGMKTGFSIILGLENA
jgi:hypothetical protein